jgi:hypothetical protein
VKLNSLVAAGEVRNTDGRVIKVIGCTASSTGAVVGKGISFFIALRGALTPVFHDRAALTAGETVSVPVPFLLYPDECIRVDFDVIESSIDTLTLTLLGEVVDPEWVGIWICQR